MEAVNLLYSTEHLGRYLVRSWCPTVHGYSVSYHPLFNGPTYGLLYIWTSYCALHAPAFPATRRRTRLPLPDSR